MKRFIMQTVFDERNISAYCKYLSHVLCKTCLLNSTKQLVSKLHTDFSIVYVYYYHKNFIISSVTKKLYHKFEFLNVKA